MGSIYESLTLPEEKMELVLYDLKVNILPKIEQQLKMRNFDKKLFSLLKEVLTYYERLQSALQQDIKKEAPKDYIFYLNLAGKTSELEMCNSVDALINSLLELQKTYPEFYNQIKSFISNLKDKKDCYTQSVELFYYDKNDDDSLLMELYYEEMKSSYDELNSIYNKFMYSIENNQEILLGLSDDFYKNARDLKNIIVFCNDDGEIISDVEKDILEERKFTTSIYGDIIKRLQDNVSEDLVAHGNHKVKNNKYYSEEFLKKYHVKSIQNGESRTFYSVFNTNLGPLFGGSNIKVMFVYLVGYGKNTNTKIDINYKALKRCYDDRRNIDYYVELFNTDWSSLSNQEFIQKRGEVFEYLKRQNIKLGHLIKSYNNRLKLEQGRGPKND